MMGETVEQCGRHLRIAEDARPFTECKIGRDDDRGSLVEAIAIKLESEGPIIFRQRRSCFGANQFVIYKFRTMTVLEDGPTVTQVCRGDLRVTRVGQFLRRSSS